MRFNFLCIYGILPPLYGTSKSQSVKVFFFPKYPKSNIFAQHEIFIRDVNV